MTNRENEDKQALLDEFRQRIKSIKLLFDEIGEEVLTYGIEGIKARNALLEKTRECSQTGPHRHETLPIAIEHSIPS